jgi:hypothetical protein
MRIIPWAMTVILVAGCAKKDAPPAADSTASAAPAANQPLALADVAGTWNMQVAPADRDTTLATYQMTATADTAGWSITFPGRQAIPMRVLAVDGDSVTTEFGPYESILRPGVQTTTRSVIRLRGARMVGTAVAHYATTGSDRTRW